MSLFLDKNGLESSLKHVAAPTILTIDPLSIDSVKLAHTTRQIRVRCLNEQVIMIGHQAMGMTEPPVAFDNFTKNLKESLAITICEEDRTERIAAARNAMNCAIKLKS